MRRNDKASHMKMANKKFQKRIRVENQEVDNSEPKEVYQIPDIYPKLTNLIQN